MMYIDMMKQMRFAMEHCLHVKPGEDVLIVTDTQMSEDIKDGLMAAAAEVGAEGQMITYVTRTVANQEVPRSVTEAILAADKILLTNSLSMNHTTSVKRATDAGKYMLSIPMVTEDLILRTWPSSLEEVQVIKEKAGKIAAAFDSSKLARLTSPEGTDITMGVGKYKTVWDYGIVERPGITTLPGGMIGTCPVEGTANGQFVIDLNVGFPGYRLVRDPITCVVKNGNVVEIKGGRDADEFRRYLASLNDPNVYHIAEVGAGANPRCKVTGNPHDDEKKAGTVRIAVGTDVTFGGSLRAKTHVDGMMSHVTLELDGKVVVKGGELAV